MSKRAYATSIKDKLVCAHCASIFVGTQKQAEHYVYNNSNLFCTDVCRYAFLKNKFSTPVPNRGPCKTCDKTFFTRRNNPKFCSMDCYTKSEQFKVVSKKAREISLSADSRAKQATTIKTGVDIECLECKKLFYCKKGLIGKKRFCTKPCYRSYLNKRFDRQIANPDQLALPQGYDGFLDRVELNCLIEGCEWTGKHLSIHVNQAHGIEAKDFKKAAGFNLHTGVISKDLCETLSNREKVGIAVHNPYRLDNIEKRKAFAKGFYKSNESKEHARKSRIFMGSGPQRICEACRIEFTQSTPMGKAKYCSIPCRDNYYAQERKKLTTPWYLRERNLDGTFK